MLGQLQLPFDMMVRRSLLCRPAPQNCSLRPQPDVGRDMLHVGRSSGSRALSWQQLDFTFEALVKI